MKRKTSHENMAAIMHRASSRENMSSKEGTLRPAWSREKLTAVRSKDNLHGWGGGNISGKMRRNPSSENLMRRDPSASLLWVPSSENLLNSGYSSNVRRKVSTSARLQDNAYDTGVLSDPDIGRDDLAVNYARPLLAHHKKASKPTVSPAKTRFYLALVFFTITAFLILGFVVPGFFLC